MTTLRACLVACTVALLCVPALGRPQGTPVKVDENYLVTAGRPPSTVCAPGFDLYGFPGQPTAWACMAPHLEPAVNKTSAYCNLAILLATGRIGVYWPEGTNTTACPSDMTYEVSSLSLNPEYETDPQGFCFFQPAPRLPSMDGWWMYCYYYPEQDVGYGFTYTPSKSH